MQSKTMTQTPTTVSASKVIGEPVINLKNEDIGKIHELVIDCESGVLAYAVLSFGGFLGMGNKLFAIPWKALELSPTERKLILNVDKEKLKNAPGFDKENWPDFTDRSWGKTVHDYYGYDTYWEL